MELKKKLMSFALIACMAGSFSAFGASEVNATATNPTQAQTLTYGNDTFGTMIIKNDYEKESHYYKFKTSSVSGIKYTVRVTCTDKMKSWDGGGRTFWVGLMDDDYDAIHQDGTKRDATTPYFGYLDNVGDVTSETYQTLKPNSTYYVRILNSGLETEGDRLSYAVCVKKSVVKPGKPVVKSCKAGKKKLTFSYYKTKYAKRYQVQMKVRGGSWKTYNNGTKLSKTIYKLKKGKKYTVRVRAQRYVSGKWYSGPWSKSRTVKVR